MINRQIAFVYVSSGWGAPDMRTANGPACVSPFLAELFKNEGVAAFYTVDNDPDTLSVTKKIPKNQLKERREHVTDVATRLCDLVQTLIRNDYFPIIIGGDHSIAMGTWSGVKMASPAQDFGLLWFDAHMDAHTHETSFTQHPHGMPLAVLLGHGPKEWTHLGECSPKIHPHQIAQLGIRCFESKEKKFLDQQQVKIFFQKDLKTVGLEKAYRDAFQHITKATPFYGVSIDVDAFDPSEAPGTGTVEPDGIHLADLIPLIKGIAHDPNCLALEITEFNPDKDQDGITLDLVLALIKTALEFPRRG
ncbi:MAG: arginase [Alphaproteobacteria bacterium]|nr:arginase [Alphaproteobacteria bacterium]